MSVFQRSNYTMNTVFVIIAGVASATTCVLLFLRVYAGYTMFSLIVTLITLALMAGSMHKKTKQGQEPRRKRV